ncbi:hypothetical protein [Bacteroides caecimuris]|nr:hypothetical protein [Bacteroides caecimuris]
MDKIDTTDAKVTGDENANSGGCEGVKSVKKRLLTQSPKFSAQL